VTAQPDDRDDDRGPTLADLRAMVSAACQRERDAEQDAEVTE
jgi:hypothetical protein